MKHSLARLLPVAGLLAMAAGCAGSSNSMQTPLGPRVAPMQQAVLGAVAPDACNHPLKETVNPAGGKFTIPSCAGSTGHISYGSNNAPAGTTVTLTSSQTNPSPSTCGTPTGETVVAYVLAEGKSTAGSVTYMNATKKSQIANPAFSHSMTFTLIAYAFTQEQFRQSLGRPSPKGVLTFPSPLNGRTVPQNIKLCFELATP